MSLTILKMFKKRIGLVIAVVSIGTGCTMTNPFDRNLMRIEAQAENIDYKYYVIDANADVPDAYFETFDEASVYQKDFAEHHEYVIVKVEEKYNVYNMEPVKNEIQKDKD